MPSPAETSDTKDQVSLRKNVHWHGLNKLMHFLARQRCFNSAVLPASSSRMLRPLVLVRPQSRIHIEFDPNFDSQTCQFTRLRNQSSLKPMKTLEEPRRKLPRIRSTVKLRKVQSCQPNSE
jgi:hypothetical protein